MTATGSVTAVYCRVLSRQSTLMSGNSHSAVLRINLIRIALVRRIFPKWVGKYLKRSLTVATVRGSKRRFGPSRYHDDPSFREMPA